MTNFARRLEIHEIVDLIEKADTQADKVLLLQKHQGNSTLGDVLRGALDDTLAWHLPPGKPPYSANVPESVPSTLQKQTKKFKYFVRGTVSAQMTSVKREQMFIQVLESIHPRDAEIVIKMINKEPLAPTITKELVKEAYPNLIKK